MSASGSVENKIIKKALGNAFIYSISTLVLSVLLVLPVNAYFIDDIHFDAYENGDILEEDLLGLGLWSAVTTLDPLEVSNAYSYTGSSPNSAKVGSSSSGSKIEGLSITGNYSLEIHVASINEFYLVFGLGNATSTSATSYVLVNGTGGSPYHVDGGWNSIILQCQNNVLTGYFNYEQKEDSNFILSSQEDCADNNPMDKLYIYNNGTTNADFYVDLIEDSPYIAEDDPFGVQPLYFNISQPLETSPNFYSLQPSDDWYFVVDYEVQKHPANYLVRVLEYDLASDYPTINATTTLANLADLTVGQQFWGGQFVIYDISAKGAKTLAYEIDIYETSQVYSSDFDYHTDRVWHTYVEVYGDTTSEQSPIINIEQTLQNYVDETYSMNWSDFLDFLSTKIPFVYVFGVYDAIDTAVVQNQQDYPSLQISTGTTTPINVTFTVLDESSFKRYMTSNQLDLFRSIALWGLWLGAGYFVFKRTTSLF